jgi:predicted ester cyclase
MPMVHSGHKTLVRYPDGTSKVITLYVRPVGGQIIAHGWEVANVAPGEDGSAGVSVEYQISVARPATEKSPEEASTANKELARRFYEEAWGRGKLDVIDEVFGDDYARHDVVPGKPPPGPEGMKRITADFRAAFPDLRLELDILLAEDDFVAARWTASGTHAGKWGDVEPTGRPATFSGADIFRFANAKVVEIWNHRDDLGLREQLGAPIDAGARTND